MKIQCDVCEKEEAAVFCSADEAALCSGCDHRVHQANKLAGKHLRFPLLSPSNFKESALCDICQERRAFLFCQEDRAILCRECDIPIHKANEHTQKHNRFLLTGVKLSPPPSSSSSSSSSSNTYSEIKRSVSNKDNGALSSSTSMTIIPSRGDDGCMSQDGSISTSSISEYLMETLPGWRVDDLLDPSCSSPHPHGFCKNFYHGLQSQGDLIAFASEDSAIWVPQELSSHISECLPQTDVGGALFKWSEEAENAMKESRILTEDGFTVPQISIASREGDIFVRNIYGN